MNTARILQGKHAVIFGAGGSIGAAVADRRQWHHEPLDRQLACLAVPSRVLKQWQREAALRSDHFRDG